MKVISKTNDLSAFCSDAAKFDFVTVDTEFLRERTYYAQLCLIQLASPGTGDENAVLVDALADGLDLGPLYELFENRGVVKVFHAARQDLEIFFTDRGIVPEPLFDTQVAAMVCGYGEQVGYETLVRSICKTALDKSSRFTDWSRRPLSQKQMAYALGDVTHLRDIYLNLRAKLQETGREEWVTEELETLLSHDTYVVDPEKAWQRVKTRTTAPRFLAAVRALARFREEEARRRDVPRGRIFKDDVIVEMAATRPKTIEDLAKSRLLNRESRKGPIAEAIIASVREAAELAPEDLPTPPEPRKRKASSEALVDLLRVLLKSRAESTGVAQKLIANSADLEELAADPAADLPVLIGWRKMVFGADAQRLCRGEIALSSRNGKVEMVDLPGTSEGKS